VKEKEVLDFLKSDDQKDYLKEIPKELFELSNKYIEDSISDNHQIIMEGWSNSWSNNKELFDEAINSPNADDFKDGLIIARIKLKCRLMTKNFKQFQM
jgi:hypothetical protein